MAWTTTDLSTIEAAIAAGTLRVQFGERSIQYHSISDLMKVRDAIQTSISVTAGTTSRTSYAAHSRD